MAKSTTLSRRWGGPNGVENGKFCRDAISFAPPLPAWSLCFHHALKRQILLLVPGRKNEACVYFKQGPSQQKHCEKFWLVLVVIRMSPWIWCAPSVLHSCSFEQGSSVLLCRAIYWPQHSSLETRSRNRFHFPLIRLIHWFQGGKSSKMHVQRELNLFSCIWLIC